MLKAWKATNQKSQTYRFTSFVRQYVNKMADEVKQRQYSNAISAATNNRSQIQNHIGKQVCFNPVHQMWNLMDHETQSFVFNNCQERGLLRT